MGTSPPPTPPERSVTVSSTAEEFPSPKCIPYVNLHGVQIVEVSCAGSAHRALPPVALAANRTRYPNCNAVFTCVHPLGRPTVASPALTHAVHAPSV